MTEAERNVLINRVYEVHRAAEKATTPAFLATLEGVKKGDKIYTFKHRLKSPTSIETKVQRKRELGERAKEELESIPPEHRDDGWESRHKQAVESATYSPDNVTDALGCRYVTLYQSEIPVTVEELLRTIEAHNRDPANSQINAYEFVIYTNRLPRDPLSITEDTVRIVERSPLFKDVPSSIRPPESRKSAYSSVHFVFHHDVEIQHPGKEMQHEQTFFEVQIRDIFEEGWGEVQHHLLYSDKDNVGDDAAVPLADQVQWSLHLNALKTFVDGCSQHASIIKSNLDGLRASRPPTTANQSVSERKADVVHLIQALRKVRAPKDTEEKVSLGYSLLLSGISATSDDEALRRLLDAAEHLDAALAALTTRQRDAKERHSGDLTIGYFIEMEAAAARLAAADLPPAAEQELQLRGEAEKIYERLVKRFPKDPTVHMRLGKMIERRASSFEDFKRSEALFDRTVELVPDDPTTGSDHWIAISARIDRGVSIWKQVRFLGDSAPVEQQASELARAAEKTAEAFEIWQQQSLSGNELNKIIGHKAASNVIFYLAAINELGAPLTPDQRTLMTQMIAEAEQGGVEPYADWYKTRDNLLHGYAALGDDAKVRQLALENFNELRARAEAASGRPLDTSEIGNYLSGSPLICFKSSAERLIGAVGNDNEAASGDHH